MVVWLERGKDVLFDLFGEGEKLAAIRLSQIAVRPHVGPVGDSAELLGEGAFAFAVVPCGTSYFRSFAGDFLGIHRFLSLWVKG